MPNADGTPTVAENLAEAVAKTGRDAQAASDRVAADLGAARTALADAQTALADYIADHPASTADLQAAVDGITAADALINSIDAVV